MSDQQARSLSIPPGAETDPEATELVRVWAAHGEQHAVLRVEAWGENPAPWGILLVDLARHVARAYREIYGRSEQESLARIRELFDAEWGSPTDLGKGRVL